MTMSTTTKLLLLAVGLMLVACGSDDPATNTNEQEVITTLTLTFTPAGGGTAVTAAFDDPDGDGGNPPSIDPITLSNATDYTLKVTFTNKLASPPEDITAEVNTESDQHQVFFTGTAVKGPASDSATAIIEQTYSDTDANGNPVGLESAIKATGAGTGKLTVTLRHVPPVNDKPVKTATLADEVKKGGITALPGETDASATFDVTVQ